MTTVNIYFHCWRNCKECLEDQTKEKIIPGEKKIILIFSRFWAKFVCAISEKFPSWLSKLQPTYLCKVLGKNIFFESEHDFNLLRTLGWKKMGLSVKSFFLVSTNKGSRFQRKIMMKKDFSFEKVFFFCYHFWSFSKFFVFLQSCLVVRCVKLAINVRKEKNWGN